VIVQAMVREQKAAAEIAIQRLAKLGARPRVMMAYRARTQYRNMIASPGNPTPGSVSPARERLGSQTGRLDGGLSALGYVASDPDPQCVGTPWKNKESVGVTCGLGSFELALILPGVMWLHRRHRRLY
jgi:hypothetical protein